MSTNVDFWEAFAAVLSDRPATIPWSVDERGDPSFVPDYGALETILGFPVGAGADSQSGWLAKGIDAWIAAELRRAGFEPDEVWPRLVAPRVLTNELALFLQGLPARLRSDAEAYVLKNRRAAPSEARVLGRAYVKQVDVVIAQWSRGPELLISTKSMVFSFRNNLPNRFEESYGDAMNLRGRYPLAAMGFLFLIRGTAAADAGTLERAMDMLRKLRADQNVYDATCLVVADWRDGPAFDGVTIRHDRVPSDLSARAFFGHLIAAVLERTPIDMHRRVRQARDPQGVAVAEVEDDKA